VIFEPAASKEEVSEEVENAKDLDTWRKIITKPRKTWTVEIYERRSKCMNNPWAL
jgi:hypothetical protein